MAHARNLPLLVFIGRRLLREWALQPRDHLFNSLAQPLNPPHGRRELRPAEPHRPARLLAIRILHRHSWPQATADAGILQHVGAFHHLLSQLSLPHGARGGAGEEVSLSSAVRTHLPVLKLRPKHDFVRHPGGNIPPRGASHLSRHFRSQWQIRRRCGCLPISPTAGAWGFCRPHARGHTADHAALRDRGSVGRAHHVAADPHIRCRVPGSGGHLSAPGPRVSAPHSGGHAGVGGVQRVGQQERQPGLGGGAGDSVAGEAFVRARGLDGHDQPDHWAGTGPGN
mmetsp:Transcript_12637/g.28061  ORF Transcript_12637/g.28061 Transcript_12637/m.28061 type:complete len:283 (+) Transcript_12637:72-920(+)